MSFKLNNFNTELQDNTAIDEIAPPDETNQNEEMVKDNLTKIIRLRQKVAQKNRGKIFGTNLLDD